MDISLRPLQPQDYEQTAALVRAATPERADCIKTWSRAEALTLPDGQSVRFQVAVAEEQVVGYGGIWPQGTGKFRMDLMVAADRRRQGIGSRLLTQLQHDLREQNAALVQARAPDTRLESLAFLTHRGFTETNRMLRMQLDVAQADIDRFLPIVERLTSQGVTIVTLEEEQAITADWQERLLEMMRYAVFAERADPYLPGSEPKGEIVGTREEAERMWQSYGTPRPNAFFLAKAGREYVGLSFLSQGSTPEKLRQGDTSVHRDWRRRGIGTALKLRTVVYAQQHGGSVISTATANPGMRALNEQLGFRGIGAEVRLVKRLRD